MSRDSHSRNTQVTLNVIFGYWFCPPMPRPAPPRPAPPRAELWHKDTQGYTRMHSAPQKDIRRPREASVCMSSSLIFFFFPLSQFVYILELSYLPRKKKKKNVGSQCMAASGNELFISFTFLHIHNSTQTSMLSFQSHLHQLPASFVYLTHQPAYSWAN